MTNKKMNGRDLIAGGPVKRWTNRIKSRGDKRKKNVRNDGGVFVGGKQFLACPQNCKWNS